jgi:hypothetical protein
MMMTTTKVINGVKMVEMPFTMSFNLCIEEHKYLEYVTSGVPVEALVQAGSEVITDSLIPVMEKCNEGWTTMMIELS